MSRSKDNSWARYQRHLNKKAEHVMAYGGGVFGGKVWSYKKVMAHYWSEKGKSMSDDPMEGMPPLMGFPQERYVSSNKVRGRATTWTSFYTCVCNGKRVYVWAHGIPEGSGTMVMVRDGDPAYGAQEAELQHMFADQHERQANTNNRRTHRLPDSDPFLLQAFIHEVTRGGNENIKATRFP